LGKSQSRELSSRIATILLHLMKLQASPAGAPRAGWRDTILEQRDEIERLLADAPSLRARIPGTIAAEMDRAKRRAEAALAEYGEQPSHDLDAIAYTAEQVLGAWLPV
jgi:hypothetical protein